MKTQTADHDMVTAYLLAQAGLSHPCLDAADAPREDDAVAGWHRVAAPAAGLLPARWH